MPLFAVIRLVQAIAGTGILPGLRAGEVEEGLPAIRFLLVGIEVLLAGM